ncbi:MAG: sulfatase-like hydrolase/transferase [Candidatus Poribacteria bacterium]|nr:sulfatase-like hydrolase/transferase [Candidatus Poribacteria bacterium]
MNKRPNILFINTDQHSWDAISAYGNPYLHTPNIDLLHQNGISFSKSYCTDPVCAAARSSWATGLYTSETGVPFNGGQLHTEITDIGQVLRSGEYKVFHCGKWHVPGRDVRESFDVLYYGKDHIGAGGAAYYDSASTHAVIDFLTSYDESEPFYLQIGYIDPHDVCEYLHNHEEKRMPNPIEQGILSEDELPPLPENFNYDERETVLHRVCRRVDDALIHSRILKAVQDWDDLHWRYFRWNYYRFIEKVDAEIGRILSVLQQTYLCDNTLVIFSADHGEACGSHQMFQKFALYEESVRVPFIVSCLGDGITVEKDQFDDTHFVSGVDLLPTVCDYARVDIPEGCQGRSLRPLAEGADISWREFAFIESNYWGRAIVTDEYKFITEYIPKVTEDFIPPGPDNEQLGLIQLFDRQNVPGETVNLAYEPRYQDVIKENRKQLLDQESKLNRQQIVNHNPQRVITNWGKRVREYWENGK